MGGERTINPPPHTHTHTPTQMRSGKCESCYKEEPCGIQNKPTSTKSLGDDSQGEREPSCGLRLGENWFNMSVLRKWIDLAMTPYLPFVLGKSL